MGVDAPAVWIRYLGLGAAREREEVVLFSGVAWKPTVCLFWPRRHDSVGATVKKLDWLGWYDGEAACCGYFSCNIWRHVCGCQCGYGADGCFVGWRYGNAWDAEQCVVSGADARQLFDGVNVLYAVAISPSDNPHVAILFSFLLFFC